MKLVIKALLVASFCLHSVSCNNKAPAEGEAFITLRSDEVRPLADAEIIFFRSDFAKDFETFRDNLIAETKNEKKSKLTQAM